MKHGTKKRGVITVYEKIRCRCLCAHYPFEFQATPMQFVGLGRVVLQAIWDEKSQPSDKNFSFGTCINGSILIIQ
jgi:hypothetical protein